jgi:GrpB-like predicted nucleotidyltransferase (UPF0157 family)
MPPELFILSPCKQSGAQAVFDALGTKVRRILPTDADIQHVGATSIPGCLTKGDIDLCVRVRTEHFTACDTALAMHFQRNSGSGRTDSFSAFHSGDAGIQLVAIGSPLDVFTAFRDLLIAKPHLLKQYNHLKQAWHGKSMIEYRSAKDVFIQNALSSV